MDGFSLIVGSMLGMMVGWAFSRGTAKQCDATRKLNQSNKAKTEMERKEKEAKGKKNGSSTDAWQSFFFNLVGYAFISVIVIVLVTSIR